MSPCNHDDLVALARGELTGAAADAANAHAAGCASCAHELAWLRAEARLFARAAASGPELPSHVWQSIERRLVIAQERKRRTRQTYWRAGGVAALAAAVVLLLILPRHDHTPAALPRAAAHAPAAATAALDGAERDYGAAIATLEAEYAAKRTHMRPEVAARYDAELAKMRETVDATRVASNDIPGRRQALRAYSAYMRSMQSIVLGGDQ